MIASRRAQAARRVVAAAPWFWLVVPAAWSASACDDTTTTTSDAVYTEVYIEPTSFRGQVPCSALPGGMKSFVGTLVDVTAKGADTDGALRVVLPSSPPAPCTTRVGFSSVSAGHYYVGEVDAFDRDVCVAGAPSAGCIVPLGTTPGGAPTGARVMVEQATGAIVAPRWSTRCGDPSVPGSLAPTSLQAPTEALYLTPVPLRGCEPMSLGGGSGTVVTTGLRVEAKALLGTLACGVDAESIERIELSLSVVGAAASPAPLPQTTCGTDVEVEGLEPAKTYLVNALAYAPGATVPRWGATCSATTAGGLQVPTKCDPLREAGVLLVRSAPLLAAFGAGCTANGDATVLARLDGTLVGVARSTSGACAADLRFAELPAGSYTVVVTASKTDGTEAFRTTCRGEVVPGQESLAACDVP